MFTVRGKQKQTKKTNKTKNEKTTTITKNQKTTQELCESRGGRPGLSVPSTPTVSVDVKQHSTIQEKKKKKKSSGAV